jgi:IS66 Orf2 like protein
MIPANTRIWIVAGMTDLRRGFTRLSALVQTKSEEDPLCGHVFCFRGRQIRQLPGFGTRMQVDGVEIIVPCPARTLLGERILICRCPAGAFSGKSPPTRRRWRLFVVQCNLLVGKASGDERYTGTNGEQFRDRRAKSRLFKGLKMYHLPIAYLQNTAS